MANQSVWYGAGVSVGGMATFVGHAQTLMLWVNDANPRNTMLTLVFGKRIGLGLHAGGAVVVGKMNGVRFANQIDATPGGGADFAVDIGEKFADVAKGKRFVDALAKLAECASDLSRLKTLLSQDGTKLMLNAITGDLFTTDKKASYAIVGIPFAGAGLGVGGWYEQQTMYPITDAGLWDVARAKWKISRIAGRPILRIHGIPETDGTEILVTGIRNVGAENPGHLIFAPPDRVAAGWRDADSSYGFLGEARGFRLYDQPANRFGHLGGRDGLDLSRYALAGIKTNRRLVPVPNQELKLQLTIMKTLNGQQNVKHAWRTKRPISVRTDENGQIESVLSNGGWST